MCDIVTSNGCMFVFLKREELERDAQEALDIIKMVVGVKGPLCPRPVCTAEKEDQEKTGKGPRSESL